MQDFQKKSDENEVKTIRCNVCQGTVSLDYIANHMNVHILTFEPTSQEERPTQPQFRVADKVEEKTSTAMVPAPKTFPIIDSEEDKKPKIKVQPKNHFRNIYDICFSSTSSEDGRYSDFAVIIFLEESTSYRDNSYGGYYNHTPIKGQERIVLNYVFDSEYDYFSFTSKLIKKSAYSSWDDETSAPERILSQEELLKETRRALLFFNINPKTSYKWFRNVMLDTIDYGFDEEGNILKSINYDELFVSKEKSNTSTNVSSSSSSSNNSSSQSSSVADSYRGSDYDYTRNYRGGGHGGYFMD